MPLRRLALYLVLWAALFLGCLALCLADFLVQSALVLPEGNKTSKVLSLAKATMLALPEAHGLTSPEANWQAFPEAKWIASPEVDLGSPEVTGTYWVLGLEPLLALLKVAEA